MAAKRHEIVGILLLAVTVALLLCLVSYSPLDSSLNSLTHKTPADNTIGRIGAEVSDRLFTLLGLSAFLLLFPLAIAGWKLLWGREIEGVYVSALGMTLLVSATSTTLELIPFRFLRDVNFPQGGIAGYLLKDRPLVDAVCKDYTTAPITSQERVMLDYVVMVTRDATKVRKDDIEALRTAGFDDRGILQITLIASWFNYINRVADALGVGRE